MHYRSGHHTGVPEEYAGHSSGDATRALGFPYRPDIDGLRALAITLVIGYHAFPTQLSGGFVGVDVFFVISGYLITGLLLREYTAGSLNIPDFYGRRIRRIFPSLLIVLIAVYAYGWFSLTGGEYKQAARYLAASAAFASNLPFLRAAGYFDNLSLTKPLFHTWSLSIEEQFYIVWPCLIYAAGKLRIDLFKVIIFLGTASFAANVLTAHTNRVHDFYALYTRAWELMMGGMLTYRAARPKSWAVPGFLQYRVCRSIQSGAGIAFVLGAALFFGAGHAYPGWWALVPTLGTCLVITAGSAAWANDRLLAHPVAVGVGLISYPLYLWHWPLLSFAYIVTNDVPSVVTRIEAIALSLILACLTYMFLERPIRARRGYSTPIALCASMAGAAFLGFYTYREGGLPRRHEAIAPVYEAIGDSSYPDETYSLYGLNVVRFGNPEAERVVFVGDSNVRQYYPSVVAAVGPNPSDHDIIFVQQGGCPPIPDIMDRGHPCADFMDKAERALADPLAKKIVFAALWSHYFDSGYYLRAEGESHLLRSSAASREAAFGQFEALLKQLSASGKALYVVLEIPQSRAFDPADMLSKSYIHRLRVGPHRNPTRAEIEAHIGEVNRRIEAIAASAGAVTINPMNYLCAGDMCAATTDDNRPIYSDCCHLRPFFARDFVPYIKPILQQKIDSGGVRTAMPATDIHGPV